MSTIDDRWIRNNHPDGKLEHIELPNGIIRVFRTMWEHACLDVDLKALSGVHRSQGSAPDDDPSTWPSLVVQIRRVPSGWQMLVPAEVLERWNAEQRTGVEQRIAFREMSPGTMLNDEVGMAQRRLAQTQQLDAGWVDLADDVVKLFDRYLPEPA